MRRKARMSKYDALHTLAICWSNASLLSRTTPRLLTLGEGLILTSETATDARSSTRFCPRLALNCMTSDFFGLSDSQLCDSHLCTAMTQLSSRLTCVSTSSFDTVMYSFYMLSFT